MEGLPIDNNRIENAIRGFALGRRDWLFFDQSHGAEESTSFYTIIETARANDIEPMHYLKFLFNCTNISVKTKCRRSSYYRPRPFGLRGLCRDPLRMVLLIAYDRA